MVFFVCEGCNETLKKNQVDKHANKCRYCEAVTCVDCSVTFYGNDYVQHTTCISEAEKYEKSLYKPKKEKAVNPQDAWVNIIEDAISDVSAAPANIRSHLTRLGQLNNVPRNKKKFINFAKNSLRLYNETLLESLWSYLDNLRVKRASPSEEIEVSNSSSGSGEVLTDNSNKDTETSTEKKKESKKDKKRKIDESLDNSTTNNSQPQETEDSSKEQKVVKKKKKNKKEKRDKSTSH